MVRHGLVSLLALSALAFSATAEELVNNTSRELNSSGARDLLAGNTALGRGIVAYYDSDGTVHAQKGDGYLFGRWWIDRSGRHCVEWEGSVREACMGIVQRGPDRFVAVRNGRPVGDFSVVEGNPNNL